MTLAEIIEAFKLEYSNYGIGIYAFAQCDLATDKFIYFAEEHGYTGLRRYTFDADPRWKRGDTRDQPNPDPGTYRVTDGRDVMKNDDGYLMCSWHCVVDAGHILIDFTARQYRHHYAFPHIIPIGEHAFAAAAGSMK